MVCEICMREFYGFVKLKACRNSAEVVFVGQLQQMCYLHKGMRGERASDVVAY